MGVTVNWSCWEAFAPDGQWQLPQVLPSMCEEEKQPSGLTSQLWEGPALFLLNKISSRACRNLWEAGSFLMFQPLLGLSGAHNIRLARAMDFLRTSNSLTPASALTHSFLKGLERRAVWVSWPYHLSPQLCLPSHANPEGSWFPHALSGKTVLVDKWN